MSVKFYYQSEQRCYKKEIIIRHVVESARGSLDLPDQVEVCLYHLGTGVHGGIDHARANRLALEIDLLFTDIPTVLVHELIHLDQRHTGKLRITAAGGYHWQGQEYLNIDPQTLPRNEYLSLPWEADVSRRLPGILREIVGKKISIST